MDHPDFIVFSFMENSIGIERVNKHENREGKSFVQFNLAALLSLGNTKLKFVFKSGFRPRPSR